jgi:hypothetical protein
VIAAVACKEVVTSPGANDLRVSSDKFSNPPPPPVEAGALTTISVEASFATQSGGITTQAVCEGATVSSFVLPVTYMFNPAGNSGFVHFASSGADSVSADANGMVRYQDGEFTGKGRVRIIIDGCELLIDLSSVDSEESTFAACGDPEIPDSTFSTSSQPERPATGCFFLSFDEVTLDGQDVGDAEMTATERCEVGDTRPECNPVVDEEEIIT